MIIFIRTYGEQDLQQVIEIYKSVFAEPPWNETWSDEQVKKDLEFALSQQFPISLIAENSSGLIGFSWGYLLPSKEFPFLFRKVSEKCSYMDEMAVQRDRRIRGIASALGRRYLEIAKSQGIKEVVLRTDIWNFASMALYKKLGFRNTGVFDPKYKNRLYLLGET